MKSFTFCTFAVIILLTSCGTSLKKQQTEAKRKKDANQLEQLEKDKANFELKNSEPLGQ